MLYPVIVFKDDTSDWCATMPDFPELVSAASTLEELLGQLQDGVEACYLGEDGKDVPAPTSLESVLATEANGAVMLVDIDFSFLDPKTERINITVQRWALAQIDKRATAKGMNRSEYLVDSAIRCG
jgi:predicted RNase H-like HicB family nuclease